jgi:hypothetical protein
MRARLARTCLSGALLISVLPFGLREHQDTRDHPSPENLGVVSFPTTCRTDVQERFERGVALLHSFAYSPAAHAFRDVANGDANCAIAHWGIAMSYFHELWDPSIVEGTFTQGRDEVHRAQRIGAKSERERGFIDALALFYEQDPVASYSTRVSRYERAMKKLAAAYPDTESQVFYALALLASASPFDKTHRNQKLAVSVLDPLFHKYPRHPGIAHYLIHACDNAEMARQGLPAARLYSGIAPSAPHAQHMPSHIFTRLGMWDDSIASNTAARAAAQRERDIGEELHAMDYLVYAYLQEGRDIEAEQIIQQLGTMSGLDEGDFKAAYASTAMPVRYVMERQQWSEAAKIVRPKGAAQVVAIAVWARAIGLARTGHPSQARAEAESLRWLEHQLRVSGSQYAFYWAKQVHIQGLEVLAWSAQAENKVAEARNLLRDAAGEEDAIEKLPVTPGPIIPAREQLGDLLLEQNQPAAALREFQITLVDAPGRRGAIIGVAQALRLGPSPAP